MSCSNFPLSFDVGLPIALDRAIDAPGAVLKAKHALATLASHFWTIVDDLPHNGRHLSNHLCTKFAEHVLHHLLRARRRRQDQRNCVFSLRRRLEASLGAPCSAAVARVRDMPPESCISPATFCSRGDVPGAASALNLHRCTKRYIAAGGAGRGCSPHEKTPRAPTSRALLHSAAGRQGGGRKQRRQGNMRSCKGLKHTTRASWRMLLALRGVEAPRPQLTLKGLGMPANAAYGSKG